MSDTTARRHRRPPLPITLVGWTFIVAGVSGLVYHWSEIVSASSVDADLALGVGIRALAVVAGIFLIRGAAWSRWAAMGWLAYHVVISAGHTLSQFLLHSVLFVSITYVLLRYHTAPQRQEENR